MTDIPTTITKDDPNSDYDNDFTVNNITDYGIWLTVGEYSVRIRRQDVGISVEIYQHYNEAENAMAECIAWDCDLIKLTEGTV